MKRVLLWSLALLAAGAIGGFTARILWPVRATWPPRGPVTRHASSASSAAPFADAVRRA